MHLPIDPRTPCPFAAGSRAKVAWLRARAAAGLPLWHPLDNPEAVTPSDSQVRNRPRSSFRQEHRIAI